MSNILIDISAPASGATTPRSKIDSLSRDDLIRFVKKQIDKLKAAKCENEKLQNELAIVRKDFTENKEELHGEQEKNAEKAEEIQQLNERYDGLKLECSDLTSQLENLKTKLEKYQEVAEKGGCNELKTDSNGGVEIAIRFAQLQSELTEAKDLLREQTEKCAKEADEKNKLADTVAELRFLLDDACSQLESFKGKKSMENVITLEMADFEKTIERLQKDLKVVNLDNLSLRSELEKRMEEVNNIREEKASLSDRIKERDGALEKLEEELEKKRCELALLEKERKDLEEQLQKQISDQNKERDQLITVIGVNEEKIGGLETLNASLNRQLMSLCSQRKSLQRQLDDLSQEHSSFKTRALYVLEQKKNDADEHTKGEIEILEETIRQQKRAIENLTNAHRILQGELDSSVGHVRTLSTEISNLQRQLNLATESHKRELLEQRRDFEARFASDAKLNNELLAQIHANSMAYNQEKENLLITAQQERESLEEKVRRLKHLLDEETKRRKEMEMIQAAVRTENVAIQSQKRPFALPFSAHLMQPSKAAIAVADEGSRNDDSIPKFDDRSLEEVIYGESDEVYITDIWNQIDNSVSEQCTTQMINKQLEHTRELLNESEATNAKLVEQTKLLKDEIRRMERDRERENHLANAEYLKNIIMKFIAPEKVTDERGRLIPVLTTMLKLSNDEVNLLSQVAEADVAANRTSASTWRNYIWPNLP
uniref:GRIP domain-containing protein n=1 Tax=Setaria digitata TaxID=48799 RepID=A0A915PX32_9BILA